MKVNYLVFGSALILMMGSLAACNSASTLNPETNSMYSSNAVNAATNASENAVANTQTNAS